MNIRSLAFLLVRLFALYFLFIFIQRLPDIAYIIEFDYPIEIIRALINLTIPLIFSLLLYKGANSISKLLLKGHINEDNSELKLNYHATANVLLAGIGVFIFMSESFYLIGRIHSFFYMKETSALLNPDQLEVIIVQAIISAIKVFVSILLIIGSKKLTQIWLKFQNWH